MVGRRMQTSKGTWDIIWENTTVEDILEGLAKERQSIRWRMAKDLVQKQFGRIKGLKIIEIDENENTADDKE